MKKIVLYVLSGLLLASSASASVGIDLNLNIGNQPRVVAVPPPPPPQARPVIIEDITEPPEFVYPEPLGFYVAVGVPYDLFFNGKFYFTFRNNGWYRAPHYRGPWIEVKNRQLPPGLRKYRLDRIRYYRDEEYRVYRGNRDHYRGRYYKPDRDYREERHERNDNRYEERSHERNEHGEHGGRGRGHE